jgi:hypothetical protein
MAVQHWYIQQYAAVHICTYQHMAFHYLYIQVHSSTSWYITVYAIMRFFHSSIPCSSVLFALLQHPAGPVLARLKIESCRIAAAERHTSSMKTISLHYSSLPTPRRRPLGGGPGAGLVGGAAADSAGDAAAARLCLWRLLGCPGRR